MKTEFIIDNVKYTKIGNSCECGGNGKVMFLASKDSEKQYAVKFFDPKIKSKNKINERYNRFKQEISFLKTHNIKGIIPIVVSHLPDKLKENDEAYYIMPRAKKIDLGNKSITDKLNMILELAMTLKEIHNLGYAHRDIKPENILFYEGRACFCDFGLIWNVNGQRLTNFNEKVGPYLILPPELREVDPGISIDYRCSDIYLLAKVLWIYLSNYKKGFYGEYSRSNKDAYLSFYEEGKVICFEPIHDLLEKATKNMWDKRISIDEFIQSIKKQISIMNDSFDLDIDGLNYITISKKMYVSENESSKKYSEYNQIYQMISNILKESNMTICYDNSPYKFKPKDLEMKENYIVLKCEGISGISIIKICVCPDYLEINNKYEFYLFLKEFPNKEIAIFDSLKIALAKENTFYLPKEANIKFFR